MLNLNNINIGYGKIGVLWDVSLQVKENEIVALVGNNGAGKSTLINTIAGLMAPSSGSIEFMGQKISGLPPYKIAKAGISCVPEGGKPFTDMTIQENLNMGGYLRPRVKGENKTLRQVQKLFPILAARTNQLARTLSGGERQMLAMGRSLMAEPKLLMFDEPSYGLSPLIVKQLFEIIKKLHGQGITILVVEQNIGHALQIADRGYVLENGRIVLQGSGAELLENEHLKTAYLGL